MARISKPGLDYFPLDVNFFQDRKVRRISNRHHAAGIAALTSLLCLIYKEKGFYIAWNQDTLFDISQEVCCEEEEMQAIIDDCLSVGLFDTYIYKEYGILTSQAIQEQYHKIITDSRRKYKLPLEQFWLIKEGEDGTENNSAEIRNNINSKGTEVYEAESHIVGDIPRFAQGALRWRLGLEHFYVQSPREEQATEPKDEPSPSPAPIVYDAGYTFMYDCVQGKRALVFSNSREETEYLCATFRQIARLRGDPDDFLIHHGNLSAALREEAELKMKDEEGPPTVTCATVTMELGIDIGKLERVLQNQSPNSITSFLQRLGRSGRRGQPPEMMMVFREEDPLPNTPLPHLMPWELLKAIAIIELYREERFIEPPIMRKQPFSLLFHQTLSILAASGELTVRRLAERVLALPPFASVSKEDYKVLLLSMLNNDFLEMTEEKTVIVGLAGERLLKSFKFYAVFKDSEDYTVRAGSDEIGTITTPPPVGDRFALAGRVWEVEELDIQRKLIYVQPVEGKMEVSWPGDYGEVHTRIAERMRQVLREDTVYPYLKPNAQKRLEVARHVARNTGLTEHSLIHLGGYSYCLFPWLGTRSFRTVRRLIQGQSARFGITGVEYEGCYFIAFKMSKGTDYELMQVLADQAAAGIDPHTLVSSGEVPLFEKYDDYIPTDLLRHAFAVDKLNAEEAGRRILEIFKEY